MIKRVNSDERMSDLIAKGRCLAPSRGPFEHSHEITQAATAAAYGALEVLAVSVANQENFPMENVTTDNLHNFLDRDHTLFAALLLASTTSARGNQHIYDFTYPTVMKAINQFKSLTGRDIRPKLAPSLVALLKSTEDSNEAFPMTPEDMIPVDLKNYVLN
jgi:hypothetical protein